MRVLYVCKIRITIVFFFANVPLHTDHCRLFFPWTTLMKQAVYVNLSRMVASKNPYMHSVTMLSRLSEQLQRQ